MIRIFSIFVQVKTAYCFHRLAYFYPNWLIIRKFYLNLYFETKRIKPKI